MADEPFGIMQFFSWLFLVRKLMVSIDFAEYTCHMTYHDLMSLFFQDLSGKMVGVWFPISMFIAIGFEHSVANMFILPAGLFSGPSQTCPSCLSDTCRPEKC